MLLALAVLAAIAAIFATIASRATRSIGRHGSRELRGRDPRRRRRSGGSPPSAARPASTSPTCDRPLANALRTCDVLLADTTRRAAEREPTRCVARSCCCGRRRATMRCWATLLRERDLAVAGSSSAGTGRVAGPAPRAVPRRAAARPLRAARRWSCAARATAARDAGEPAREHPNSVGDGIMTHRSRGTRHLRQPRRAADARRRRISAACRSSRTLRDAATTLRDGRRGTRGRSTQAPGRGPERISGTRSRHPPRRPHRRRTVVFRDVSERAEPSAESRPSTPRHACWRRRRSVERRRCPGSPATVCDGAGLGVRRGLARRRDGAAAGGDVVAAPRATMATRSAPRRRRRCVRARRGPRRARRGRRARRSGSRTLSSDARFDGARVAGLRGPRGLAVPVVERRAVPGRARVLRRRRPAARRRHRGDDGVDRRLPRPVRRSAGAPSPSSSWRATRRSRRRG